MGLVLLDHVHGAEALGNEPPRAPFFKAELNSCEYVSDGRDTEWGEVLGEQDPDGRGTGEQRGGDELVDYCALVVVATTTEPLININQSPR
jgi:hypothetical protein